MIDHLTETVILPGRRGLDPVDETDGQPVWPAVPVAGLVPGVELTARLGVGHRCETWRGWSSERCCPVAVKIARPHLLDHPRARQTLRREVAALDGLLHPVLPRLYHDGTDADRPYVLLEHLDGPDLVELVEEIGRGRALDPLSLVRLGTQLLSALVPLHARGLAHLDLKPENVMISHARPIMIDFGSSRRIGSTQPAGQPVGTFGWAAPEMEACAPIAAAMDVYGVGAVLRYAGALAAAGSGRSRGARLARIVRRMLAEDPRDRPGVVESLGRLADALPRLDRFPVIHPSRGGAGR